MMDDETVRERATAYCDADRGGSGFNVVIRLIGETDEVEIQTRWKERDGEPTIVEASHLSQTARAAAAGEEGAEAESQGVEG